MDSSYGSVLSYCKQNLSSDVAVGFNGGLKSSQ